MSAPKPGQRGFTLTEMMVVVAIVGILTALGAALLRNAPRPVDAASVLSSKLSEASRKAVGGGSVRADVAAALGSTARTRVRLAITANVVNLSLQRLEEDPEPATSATWVELSSVTLHQTIRLAGYTPSADLTGGALGPSVSLGSGDSLEVRCHPDGSCDGMTIYLTDEKARRRARLVVLPLGGTPMTFDHW